MTIQNPHRVTSLSLMFAAGVIAIGCSSSTPSAQGSGDGGGPIGINGGDGGVGADGGSPQLPSACARIGGEVRVTQGVDVVTFALAWDKDHYVLVYADTSAGSPGIYGVRLDENGQALAGAVAIAQTHAPARLPTIALMPNGGYFVAWEEGENAKVVHARMVAPDLHPTSNDSVLATTASEQARPIARATSNGVALAWMDQVGASEAVNVAVVDTAMKMTGPKRVAMNDSAGYPWLAGDASGLALLWSDKRGGPYDIHFSPLDMSLTATADVTVRTGPAGDALLGRMVKTSFGWLAAWEDQTLADKTHVYMSLLGPDGSKISDGLVEEDDGNANWPNIAWNGSAAAIVYYEWRTGEHVPQIYMTFVDGTGKRVGGLHDLRVSTGPGTSQAKLPDVVWTGKDFGVVWTDTRDGGQTLYFARVACQS